MSTIRNVSSRAIVTTGVVAFLALGFTTTAQGAERKGDPQTDASILVADRFSRGDYVGSLDGVQVEVKIYDGLVLTALDSYGNETKVVVQGEELWAAAPTVATTDEGAKAMAAATPAKQTAAQKAEGRAVVNSIILTGCATTWVAPYPVGWVTSNTTCGGHIGLYASSKKTYGWFVDATSNGEVNTRALGYYLNCPPVAGQGCAYYASYYASGAGRGRYHTVSWGAVASNPKMKFDAYLIPWGATGKWN